MPGRILVFGGYRSSPEEIQNFLSRLFGENQIPEGVVIPKCQREFLFHVDFDRLEQDEIHEALIRGSVLLDLEGFIEGTQVDLVIGFGQGVTFLTMAIYERILGIDTRWCLLIGTKIPRYIEPRPRLTGMKIFLISHPKDHLSLCSQSRRERLMNDYLEGKQQLIEEYLQGRFLGFTRVTKGDLLEFLDEHSRLLLEKEQGKLKGRTKMSPVRRFFLDAEIEFDLSSVEPDPLDDPRILMVIRKCILPVD